jgi:porphobilinogen synthase
MTYSIPLRLKRLRRTPQIRAMVRETHIKPEQLIAPLFISETLEEKREIKSMPGHYQLTLNDVVGEAASLKALGIYAVILFGIPAKKDAHGSASLQPDGIIQKTIALLREKHPDLLIIADTCFCEYTDHGHCGVLKGQSIDNDETLDLLAQQAVSFANAGADWIAPSGMTDGMVAVIRQALDAAGHQDVAILSYAVKYSSSFYGPFREAAEGAPQFGDRTTYQMDPANANEALREASLDLGEGADMLMVKPAMSYLDIIYRIKESFPDVPLCAYQVSGEFSMIKNAAKAGLLDEQQAMIESLISIKRAGADMIITYFAKDIAPLLHNYPNF